MIKVVKFGGSSLASATQIKKAKNILYSDDTRKYCIASASGKRDKDDEKITDLLINLHKNINNDIVAKEIYNKIKDRYIKIVEELNITYDIEKELDYIFKKAKTENLDFVASRGEYLTAKILSIYCNEPFLDMQNVIIFNDDKKVNYDLTYANIKKEIENIEKINANAKIIIPGFYGSNINGDIITFSRGGSDITGSLVARALNANLYENWTDVSGVLFVDPRIVENPKVVEYISYTELRELSYMGANVLHEEAVYPVSKVGIPINILNTNVPTDKGTMIVSNIPSIIKRNAVTGIAGKKGFTSILIQKALMNEEIGYLAKLLNIFDNEKISVEHCPTGIDTVSVIVRTDFLNDKKDKIINTIKKELSPDVLSVEDNMAIIAIVGEGMKYSNVITKNIFNILADKLIPIKMIDQGSSGINIIIGIGDNDYEKALAALSELQNL
ncbi:MAG: aspartate kinase [Lachnospiraceae bacterium]|nr:aspartate kinase [Lachnospiraceae bacterium]